MSTVLIVDDERPKLAALERVLSAEKGLSVITAGNGESALELLGSQEIDLILADRFMPGIDGVALLSKVRERFPDVSMMLLTESDDDGRRRILDELGDKLQVVVTPWDEKALRRDVRETLFLRTLDDEQRLLVRECGVTPEQLQRAGRIRSRLQQDRPLGELLVELGAVTQEQLDAAKALRRSRLDLVELLREDGYLSEEHLEIFSAARRKSPDADTRTLLVDSSFVTEEQYLEALCTTRCIPFVSPEVGSIDTELLNRTSFRYLTRLNVLPVRVEDDRLVVIVPDPLDRELFSELERNFGLPIAAWCSTTEKISEALRTLERLRAGKNRENSDLNLQYREIADLTQSDDTGEEAVQIVDYLLARAIQLEASDLHIEPLQEKIRVRVRVDGALQQLTDLPIDFAPRVVSRLKILSGADIAEKRLHQDGKIFVKIDGREVDIRLSSYVSVFGETMVMRLLDRNKGILPLDKVGFTPRAFAALTEVVLESSSGLVLLVGPTGSGKTTTLYSFIDHANDPSEKVITCEDPVEYVIDGIIQCSVNQKTGPTFNQSLRAIVRQDPDTIIVGEVRDGETAGLALESALTGHKVFSTFHTEDAVGAFIRLLEMGTEPFLVASTLSAIVAQRLVRRLCSNCRKQVNPDRAELRFLGIDRGELRGTRFHVPGGCSKCGGSGYKGRVAIHEVLLPDDDLRDAVLHRSPAKELRELARKLPEFLTLQEDGVLKAVAGRTSLAEIIANAPRDTSARPLPQLKKNAEIGRS